MNVTFCVYDVFAESPFAGTQIAVIVCKEPTDDALKLKIVSEFNHSETVFVEQSNDTSRFSVYNVDGKTSFGAHTTLAAARAAHDLGISDFVDGYAQFDLVDGESVINTFIDSAPTENGRALFARSFEYIIDRYVPESSSIADALKIDVKNLSYSRYMPRLVHVDTPVLVVPVTKPESVIAAQLDVNQWRTLLSETYANYILLIAPGSITGRADFHGRLIHPSFKPGEFPPIGSVVGEFIAYLRSCDETSMGTHSVTIDRGSIDTRQSLIHTEFDNVSGNKIKCRIGGNVILMSEGQFIYS